jgi:crotonobetainyl-CoA:carnitine CoA-transferase CaiB-like acyl-CoA transferase
VFLVGQHMLQYAMTGAPPQPMPARQSPWAIYDVFTVKDGEQIFLAAVSDAQWTVFCDALGLHDLKADPDLATNNQRVAARPRLLPALRERLADRAATELAATMERAGLPFAPINRPEALYDDPHLAATGGLSPVTVQDGPAAGRVIGAPLLPLALDGARLGTRLEPPPHGGHTDAVLRSIGYDDARIAALRGAGVVA